jgi:glycosyltransferase involved in cell wall biosynthesis
MFNTSLWLLLDSRGFGGIERHAEILGQELRARNFQTEIVFWEGFPDKDWIRRLKASGQPFRLLDGRLGTLIRQLRTERPALLHTHGYKANILGRAAAMLTGTSVAATFHAGLREPFPVGLYQRLDEITSFLGGRISVSEAIRASLPFSSRLVENFIATPPRPQPLPLPLTVSFVGRLTPEKGIDLFCEIAAKGPPSIEWQVYGEGPLRQELEAAYGSLVHFHGFARDMSEVWRRTGLLMMPSRAEGLPMAAIEALSQGIPVAASRVGGLPRAVLPGVSGWLFEAGDIDAACRAIESWTALEPERQIVMRLSCWRHAATNYSAEAALPGLLEEYARQAPGLRNTRLSSASSHP